MKEYRQHRFEKPVGAVDVILVRHGESRAARPEEPFPLVAGQGDPELSALGTNKPNLLVNVSGMKQSTRCT
jgi:probable phosphoglycerate mutase